MSERFSKLKSGTNRKKYDIGITFMVPFQVRQFKMFDITRSEILNEIVTSRA